MLAILAGRTGAWRRFQGGFGLRNASTVWRQVATADGPLVPGTDSEGAWQGRWCLAPIRRAIC